MFSSLKRNSIVHILEKGDRLLYKTGQVESFTQPVPQYPQFGNGNPFNPNVEYVMDITLRVGEDLRELKQVPSNLGYASLDNGNFILSETRDGLVPEVQNTLAGSENIIASVDYHKRLAEDCKDVLRQLNPQYAKEEERDSTIEMLRNEFANFKEEVTSMKSDMGKVLSILQKSGNS